VGLAAWAPAAPASAAPPGQAYVDRRVNALPSTALLHADARTLIDPRRQQIASTLVVYRRVLFLFWAFSQIYALFWVWRNGTGARLRDALRRLGAQSRVLALLLRHGARRRSPASRRFRPRSRSYRVALVFDQSSQPIAQWALDGLLAAHARRARRRPRGCASS
jgi:hypothetical protein